MINSLKNILIIGNGPSTRILAERGFHSIREEFDTFGMGAAYRYFYGIGWWPTYYACCDSKVVFSHRNSFKKTIEDNSVTTRKFFFPIKLSESARLEIIPHSSTGDFCIKKAAELGYEKIYTIGMGGNYIEKIDNSRPLDEHEINKFQQKSGIDLQRLQNIRVIDRASRHAGNYFFSWYQMPGDVYSLPRGDIHRNRWREIKDSYGSKMVDIGEYPAEIESAMVSRRTNKGDNVKNNDLSFGRIVGIIFPTLRTNEEWSFWGELLKEISQRGYRPLVVSKFCDSQAYNRVINHCEQVFVQLEPKKMNLKFGSNDCFQSFTLLPQDLDLAGHFSLNKLLASGVSAAVNENLASLNFGSKIVAQFLSEIINYIQPIKLLITNDTTCPSMMVAVAAHRIKAGCLFVERSPTISQWFEPEGFYAGASALGLDNCAWQNDPKYDQIGALVLAQLESNPAMHRSTAKEQGFQLQDGSDLEVFASKGKPAFLFPMDAVLNTGWLPTGHPKRALNYPMFETPFDAIRALKSVAEHAGAQLWIKPHPGCRVFDSDDSFEGVPIIRGSIDEALARADLVFCFLTKVAFAALAQKKRTVLLSPSIASLCPAAFACETLEDIEPTVARALAHDWSDGDTTSVRRFLGWLDRDYFIANDLSNPAAERMLDQFFPPLPAHLPEPEMETIMKKLDTVPGSITPKRPVDAPADPDCLLGPFERDHDMRLDEVDVILSLFKSGAITPENADDGVMLDVGACKGSAFEGFAEMGWEVHAFEPNPPMYAHILEHRGHYERVKINQLAVSETSGECLPFYTSEESIGISSLSPFRDTHKPTAIVKTIRLDEYYGNNGIYRADFLKIDTEGFDIFVLKSHDWLRFKPKAIICEYEDFKTEKLGYRTEDTAALLEAHGYTVYVSEWHPIIQYGGGTHRWKAFKRWQPGIAPSSSWGNLVAFRDPIPERVLSGTVQLTLEQARLKRLRAEVRPAKALEVKPVSQTAKVANDGSRNPQTVEEPVSLREANRLLREGELSKALQMYLHLHAQRPMQMYADNAFYASKKLGIGQFDSIEKLRQRLQDQ